MRKMKRKTWETIGIVVVCTALIVGILGGLVALFGEEKTTKKISPSFSIGGLTSQGKYLETKESIYTKELFECRGLTITPDFESQVSYQVFFYNAEGEFIRATSKQTGEFNSVPLLATHARLVVTPNDDTEIKFYEVNKYAKQLKIEVDLVQKVNFDEIFDDVGNSNGSTNNGENAGNESTGSNSNSGSETAPTENLYSYWGYGFLTHDKEDNFIIETDTNYLEFAWSNSIDTSNIDYLLIKLNADELEKTQDYLGTDAAVIAFSEVTAVDNGYVVHFKDKTLSLTDCKLKVEVVSEESQWAYLLCDVTEVNALFFGTSLEAVDYIQIVEYTGTVE